MTDMAENPFGMPLWPVDTPSGSQLELMDPAEASYYEDRAHRYTTQLKFTEVSDLQDLDRVLLLEVMIFRWSRWLTSGFDYFESRVNEKELRDYIENFSRELRLLKKSLGIDKQARDADKGQDSATFIQNLLRRAKEHGVHRDNQYELAVNMLYKLRSLVTTMDRADEEEAKILDLSPESIIEWVRQEVIPAWDELDAAYRKNQKMWVREVAG